MLRVEVWIQNTDVEFLNYEMTTLTLLNLIKMYLDNRLLLCSIQKEEDPQSRTAKLIQLMSFWREPTPLLNIWRMKKRKFHVGILRQFGGIKENNVRRPPPPLPMEIRQ